MATAKQTVDAARTNVALVAPPAALDVAPLAGKTLWLINVVNNQLTTTIGDGFTKAAEAAGMKGVVFDGKGDASQWNAGFAQAVAQNAAGIVLLGIDENLVSGPLADAKKAGIPVVDLFNGSPSAPLADGVYAHVTPDFTNSGKVLASWILADSGCKADTVLWGASVLPIHNEMVQSAKATLNQLCPDCKVDAQDVDLANVATDIGNKAANALRRDPDINYLFPVFDSAVTFVAPAVQSAGSSVKIVSHDGVDANLDMVRSGGPQVVDMAFPPNAWIGWALVDQLGRGISKLPAADYTIPTQIFDSTNIGNANDKLFPNYDGYEAAFLSKWGVG